jgi:hypothetical protein
MHNTVKVAIIAGAFGLLGAVVGNVAPIIKATQRDVPSTTGVGELTLKLGNLPKPSPEILHALLGLDRKELELVLGFPTLTFGGAGLTFTCLTDQSQQELATLERLEALGLGRVIRPAAEAPEAVTFPVLIEATSSDESGAAYAVLDEEMAMQYCSAATICPDRFAFEPSDAGISLRNYLRDLLGTQILTPKS